MKSFTRPALLAAALALASALPFLACSSVDEGPLCASSASYPTEAGVVPSDLMLAGATSNFNAANAFVKCGEPQLIVLRVTAPWCGTCGWHEREWDKEVSPELRSSTKLYDVVVGDSDNAIPTLDLARARLAEARTHGVFDVLVDPEARISRELAPEIPLPAYIAVDARTMKVVARAGNPSPGKLRSFFADARARSSLAAAPASEAEPLFDNLFTRNEWDLIRSVTLPTTSQPDPSNRYADNSTTAAVGRSFFFETEWSANKAISCETCHRPDAGFADANPVSKGIGKTNRNAPTVLTAGSTRWFFADGRADSAWMQALGPLEDANEFGGNRLRIAHVIAEKYGDRYDRAFGKALPDISDLSRFPAQGKPGDAAWEGMAEADRTTINEMFANVGKAIAAYERTLRVMATPFDRYAAGEMQALTAEQKLGLKEFFTFGCAQCHYGPTLSDDAFHALRFPTGRPDGGSDFGRQEAFKNLSTNLFTRSGPFSDAKVSAYSVPPIPMYTGAFKTPTLRAIASTAPYGHGGNVATLDALVEIYRTAGLPASDPRAVGTVEPWVPTFKANEGTHLSAFMATFVGGAQWW